MLALEIFHPSLAALQGFFVSVTSISGCFGSRTAKVSSQPSFV